MKVGMLWFDDDPSTGLIRKVRRAAEFYHRKYGSDPDTCQVHPSMLADHPDPVDQVRAGIRIHSDRGILPGHLWIGIEDQA